MSNAKFLIPFCCLAIAFLFFSCKSKTHPEKDSDTPTSGEISISVDETFQRIIQKEVANFEHLYPNAKINALYKPEGDAVSDLVNNKVRLIIIPRQLNEKELNYFRDIEAKITQVKIATDAICFIVNSENPDTNVTSQQALNILKGSLSTWQQLNSNSKITGAIEVVFDNANSSTVRYLKDLLNGSPLTKTASAAGNNPAVVSYVESNKNALGVIGVSWISESEDSLTVDFLSRVRPLAVANDTLSPTEFYKPFQYYMMKGQYPFWRSVYIVSREARAGLGTGFARYVTSDDGQRIILRSGLVPATQPIRIIELKNEF